MPARKQSQKMTRGYNLTMALMKVDTAPVDALTDELIASIARTHRVPIGALEARLVVRKAREAEA